MIFIVVLYWIFLKKYEKSGPKYKERLPYNNFRRSSYCNETLLIEKKKLKFEAEGREFLKILRSLEQFIQTVKGQNNFW